MSLQQQQYSPDLEDARKAKNHIQHRIPDERWGFRRLESGTT